MPMTKTPSLFVKIIASAVSHYPELSTVTVKQSTQRSVFKEEAQK